MCIACRRTCAHEMQNRELAPIVDDVFVCDENVWPCGVRATASARPSDDDGGDETMMISATTTTTMKFLAHG